MAADLILLQQGHLVPVQSFALSEGQFILGRSADCDFVIRDCTVSRRHAQIVVNSGSVSIRDLGSRNGTYIDDETICANSPFQQGQRVRLGNVSFVLTFRRKRDPEGDSELETEPCTEGQNSLSLAVHLSPAQQRVFDQLLTRLADKEIARKLSISPKTVHLHVQAIFRSLGVHSRSELLAAFVRRSTDSTATFRAILPSAKR